MMLNKVKKRGHTNNEYVYIFMLQFTLMGQILVNLSSLNKESTMHKILKMQLLGLEAKTYAVFRDGISN
ncbi:hypothetical protein HanXRQr2_Chr09g0377921 [Helianthus annuus]|uniref:Uncharacterized protein n=1 Tax=Helianthus annuus TaxID=4232 RepID=A0A9K3I4Z8_HELAN|nr:hypothetical protein HanXRQr2_Chr09g0377921 [Helianthus annuus]